MSDNGLKLLKAIARLKEAAMTIDHKQLTRTLEDEATRRGYAEPLRFNGCRPDVARWSKTDSGIKWWISDAKVAESEGPTREETAEQVRGYISLFIGGLRTNAIIGGRFAIATNERQSAGDWKDWLDAECAKAGLLTSDGGPPDFAIKAVGPHWVVLW